jgi:SagB-type dehydrogenase family enzyme
MISLPQPRLASDFSIEEALQNRRTVRDFAQAPITLADLSQLLWAAQGITSPEGYRTAPSAGALYPLEVYLVVGNVEDLAPAIYRYDPDRNALKTWQSGDRRAALTHAALRQRWMEDSAVVLAFCAVSSRTTGKYGDRGERYIFIEVGHAAQNVFLQAQSLGLAAAAVGAFEDRAVGRVLDLPGKEHALYLMPIGKPAR